MISPGAFFIFSFFKMLVLQVVKGVKGQKMAQNDKKVCLSHILYQELCIIHTKLDLHQL